MGKPASKEEARLALPSNCAGTPLLPGNRRCFLSKMQRWGRMGHLFFSGSSTNVGVTSVAWLQSQPWPLGAPTHPVLDPRKLWAPWWVGSMQGTEEGPESVSGQH